MAINGIPDDHDYLVKIPVPASTSFHNVDLRFAIMADIDTWSKEITEWQGTFTIRMHTEHVYVWFKFPEHATVCALRWL